GFARGLGQIVDQRRATTLERLERSRRIVREARLPTAREETAPCESPGAPSRLGRFALVAWRLVLDVCPAGMPERCRSPCHARGAEERRPLQAPGPPGLRATAFRDRCAARLVVACLGGGAACPLCAEGHEEARSKDGPGPWQGGKPGAVRRGVGPRCTG